jgi:hypothetical protein
MLNTTFTNRTYVEKNFLLALKYKFIKIMLFITFSCKFKVVLFIEDLLQHSYKICNVSIEILKYER